LILTPPSASLFSPAVQSPGERLYVSKHTVKAQALSIDRKLGVSSRSQAVERAQQLGLGA